MDYSKLVEVYERIAGTTKRLEKTFHIAELLKKTPVEDIEVILLLLQGKVFPTWDEAKIGLSSKLVLKVISKSSGADIKRIEDEWRKVGDLGVVAFNLISKKTQHTLFSTTLTVKKVMDNFRKLAVIEGIGSVDKKIALLSELLTSSKPLEAKYIVRSVLEELRVGVGEGSLRDAILWANFGDELEVRYDREKNDIMLDNKKREKYNLALEIVQHAFDLTNDFAIVAKAAKTKGLDGLKNIKLALGKPIKVMLCQKVEGVEEGFERVGSPAQIEYKYDGFRMQIHKEGKDIRIFTRRLEDVTKQFPEVIAAVKQHVKGRDFIIDCEAVGHDPNTGKYMPFQSISQRIKRKYDILNLSRKLPVEINVFDVLYLDGKVLIDTPLDKRREIVERIVAPKDKKIIIAKVDTTSDIKEAKRFYSESLDAGNEGIIMKRQDSLYKPGSRVGGWVKVKPVMESIDVVIVGAEWGEGKRSGWLTSFTAAIIDDNDSLLEIGKVGTGIKELEQEGVTFDELTKLLKPLVTVEKGREVKVKPHIIIEVNFEEIQKSPTYSSGYALRFPRFVRIREDRGPKDATTLEMIKQFFDAQRGRS